MSINAPLRLDSHALVKTIAAASARSSFHNGSLGFGTARDPLNNVSIARTAELSDLELATLYEQEHLIQKIAYVFPQESANHWFRFTVAGYGSYGLADDDLQGYLNSRCDRDLEFEFDDTELAMGSLSALFAEASFTSRVFGSSYLLLGVDDGRDWDEPIAPDSIRSLRWIEPLCHNEVTPIVSSRGYSKPQHFRINLDRAIGDEEKQRDRLVHRSRILPFYGVPLTEFSLKRRGGRQLSVLQGVFKALATASQMIAATSYLVSSASVFTYGLKGLSEIQDEAMQALITSRFESIMMSLSVLKGLPHDAEQEEIGFASRQFGGLRDLVDLAIDQIAQNCDVPRFKLLEASDSRGLSNKEKAQSERYLWAQLEENWRVRHWRDHFLYLGKIAARAKDSPAKGRSLKSLSVEVPSSLQMTPEEELNLRKLHLETVAIAIDKKIIMPFEARQSTYGGSSWSQEIVLDDRATKQLEEEMLNPKPEPIAPPQNAIGPSEKTPTKEDDRSDSDSDADWEAMSAIATDDIKAALRGITNADS